MQSYEKNLDNYRNEDMSVVLQRSFFNKVYGWMCFGLLLTAGVAYYVAGNEKIWKAVFGGNLFIVLVIAQIVLVMGISAAINKISAAAATAGFCAYAALNGVILSSVLIFYAQSSVASAFLTTSGMFGVMSLYGLFTKRDLSGIGSMLSMALIGVIIASLINMFVQSGPFDLVLSIIGVIIFVGLTAYDTQKIRRMAEIIAEGNTDSENIGKGAIMGALTLYLDFINLFLLLLRLFGGGNRK